MSAFEPPPPDRFHLYPSFRPLFGEDHLYLELLHLPSGRPHHLFAAVERAVASSPDADAELAALFAERNWRCHLVAAATLLACGSTRSRLDGLWGALESGSWAAPQLAVAAWLLDEEFERRARRLILGGSWAKTAAGLGRLYRRLPSPKLQVLAQLAEALIGADEEARDGELYAAEWLAKLGVATTAEMRARWLRSPDPAVTETLP